MACNGCNGNFSFGAIFIPFTPLTAQKIKIKKKKKKKKKNKMKRAPGDNHIILHVYQKF